MEAARWPSYELPQGAIVLAVPGKTQGAAKVWVAFQAELAGQAGDGRVNRHALTVPWGGFIFHQGGKLMSQDEWLDKLRVADAGVLVPVQI